MKRLWNLAWLFLLSACSGHSGGTPVIDQFEMPATATMGADGNYHLAGNILAHETDGQGSVQIVHVRVPSLPLDQRPFYGPPSSDRPTNLAFDLSGSTPKGTIAYEVSVIDSNGAESAVLKTSVVLQ